MTTFTNEIEKGVAILDRRGEHENIVANEETMKMNALDVTFIILKDGELQGIKTSGSPTITRMTQHQLDQFDNSWNFQTEL